SQLCLHEARPAAAPFCMPLACNPTLLSRSPQRSGRTFMDIEDDANADRRIHVVAAQQPPFARLMGLKIVEVTRDRVVAEVVVREELTNRNGGLHGGAVMGIADNLGGTATFVNMPEGAGTTTIESKTNFFAAVPAGDTIRAECTPLHRGRTTMVWQT